MTRRVHLEEAAAPMRKASQLRLGAVGLLLLAMLSGLNGRAASVPALGVDADQLHIEDLGSSTNGMIGWTFFLTEPITVTGLGWYDYGHDGLVDSHQIGIWKDLSGLPRDQLFYGLTNMSLLASATVAAGTEAPLNGPWRTVDLPSLTLQPGG